MTNVVGTIQIVRKHTITFSLEGTQNTCRDLAIIAAQAKMDGLYRFFAPNFVIAYSSLNGTVRPHNSICIPTEHW